MNMLQKLDILMAERGINKSQLATQAGIPKTTVYGWYKKGYDEIRRPTLQALADFFSVTMEYLTNDNIEFVQKEKPATGEGDGLTDEEWEHIKLYRAASPELQAAALAMLEAAEKARLARDLPAKDK